MSYIGKEPQYTDFPSKFFNGNGTAMTVTLDYAPPNLASLLVFIDGVRQDTSAYTISGYSLTFTGVVPSGTNNVQVVHMGMARDVNVPALDSVATASIQDDAVTAAKLNTTGTASASTFLRGDMAWDTVPDPIESGTKMMFVQTTAPTGWTKDTTHDNKALRVVSGTASSGGSVAFTTAFASQAVSGSVGNTSLSTAQLASHTHTSYYGLRVSSPPYTIQLLTPDVNARYNFSSATSATGSGNSHNHSFSGTAIDMAVQYVDTIIATKD